MRNFFSLVLPLCLWGMVSCGSDEKENNQPEPGKDTLTQEYVEEETGKDPEGFPCGMKGYSDTAHTQYRGSDLRIVIAFACPGEISLADDATEKSLANQRDQDNFLILSLKGKKFDTSFVMLKKYFLDSLGSDFLEQSVIGSTSFVKLEGREDFVFASSVGRAYTDDAMVVTYVFNRKKGIRVRSALYPEMGEGNPENE